MSAIRKKIDRDYLFGCIKYRGKYEIYLMPIAYWILNNLKYNPIYNPNEWEFVFRNNILNVSDDKIIDFLKAVAVDKIDVEELSELAHIPKELVDFYFFIDLDKKLYVSSFPDIEVEDYLPDDTWTGLFDNPIDYLPTDLKIIFDSR